MFVPVEVTADGKGIDGKGRVRAVYRPMLKTDLMPMEDDIGFESECYRSLTD